MKNKNRTLIRFFVSVFIYLFFFNAQALSQLRTEIVNGDTITVYRYENKDNISIEINTDIERSDGSYLYKYSLFSQLSSQQNVYSFEVFLKEAHEKFIAPEGWFGLDGGSKSSITWASRDSTNRLGPGEQKGGFEIISKGLPAILSYSAKGWTEIPVFEVEPDSFENASISKDSKKGFTVGPGISPENIEPASIADSLNSFVDRSCNELGWITNQGICRSLEAKLDNVERQLDRGNTNAATGPLQAFLNEVQAQKDKQISSEAYALLYFYGQHLMERLNQ